MNRFDLKTGKCLGTFPEHYVPPASLETQSHGDNPKSDSSRDSDRITGYPRRICDGKGFHPSVKALSVATC
jgi:hypothetical protein